MSETFHPGELFVYVNGDRWELGMVKRPCDMSDAYFCWYSRGDTASWTPTCNMHKLANADWTHIEQVLDDVLAANAARTMLIQESHEQLKCIGYELGECWSCPQDAECMAKAGSDDDG